MQILTKSGNRYQKGFSLGYGYPGKIRCKRRQRVYFIYKGSVEVPGMARERATWDYLGRSIQQDGYWSKDLEYRPGAIFKGTSR